METKIEKTKENFDKDETSFRFQFLKSKIFHCLPKVKNIKNIIKMKFLIRALYQIQN